MESRGRREERGGGGGGGGRGEGVQRGREKGRRRLAFPKKN